MTLFLILGAVGLVSLLVGLFVGEVDVELGPDWLSLPVLAALVGAFGFVGAAALSLGAPTIVAVGAGAVAGLALAAATFRLVRGLMHMATDAPLRSSDLVGRPGRVVTALTGERTGEVLVSQAGQQLKLAARSNETITVGQSIVVVEIVSPTLVRVESHDRFWSPSTPIQPDTRQPDGGPPP